MENFRDAELKKWLAEEYEKETEEMEKILFPDGVIPDDGETEEEAKAAYRRLVERLKADGVYKEDETDSIKTDDHKENVKFVYLPEKKSHKAARVAAAVLVCSAGIFAASMTSQANRRYFIDSVRYWVGHDMKIVVDNDRTNEKECEDEQTALDNIEKEISAKVPQFMYRPDGFEFKDYYVSTSAGYAVMEYYYGENIIMVYIGRYDQEAKSSAYILDGKVIDKVNLENENITVNIEKVKDDADTNENYVACWKDESIFYQITGKMQKEEFIKFIKNIVF